MEEQFEYEEEGQVVGTLLNYSIGFGLVIVIIIFMVVLGAKVYESQQADIALLADSDLNSLNGLDGNPNIVADINKSILGAFNSMSTFTGNLDIIAIAVVFGVALVVILGAFSGIGIGGLKGNSGGFSAI